MTLESTDWPFEPLTLLPGIDLVVADYDVASQLAHLADHLILVKSPLDTEIPFPVSRVIEFDSNEVPFPGMKFFSSVEGSVIMEASRELSGRVLVTSYEGRHRSPGVAAIIVGTLLGEPLPTLQTLKESHILSNERNFRIYDQRFRPHPPCIDFLGTEYREAMKKEWYVYRHCLAVSPTPYKTQLIPPRERLKVGSSEKSTEI